MIADQDHPDGADDGADKPAASKPVFYNRPRRPVRLPGKAGEDNAFDTDTPAIASSGTASAEAVSPGLPPESPRPSKLTMTASLPATAQASAIDAERPTSPPAFSTTEPTISQDSAMTSDTTAAQPDDAAPEVGAESTASPDNAAAGTTASAMTLPSQQEVDSTIKTFVVSAMALAMVPVPVFDLVVIIGLQVKMVHSLTRLYGVPFHKDLARSLIVSLVGGLVPFVLAGSATSMIKMIPGLGSIWGGVGLVILAGALTYATGRIFASHLASGGTLLTLDVAKVRDQFRREFKAGRTVAKDLQDDAAEAKASGETNKASGETSPASA